MYLDWDPCEQCPSAKNCHCDIAQFKSVFIIQFDDGTTLGPGAFGENIAATMSSPQLLHHWLGDEWFRRPVELALLDSQVTDETIAACADGMPNLRLLSISSLNVTDQAMPDISTLAKLESLTLNCPLLTPEGLAKLRPLKSLRKFVSIKVRGRDSTGDRLIQFAKQLGTRPMPLAASLEIMGEVVCRQHSN